MSNSSRSDWQRRGDGGAEGHIIPAFLRVKAEYFDLEHGMRSNEVGRHSDTSDAAQEILLRK
jgi:hypothetical protein